MESKPAPRSLRLRYDASVQYELHHRVAVRQGQDTRAQREQAYRCGNWWMAALRTGAVDQRIPGKHRQREYLAHELAAGRGRNADWSRAHRSHETEQRFPGPDPQSFSRSEWTDGDWRVPSRLSRRSRWKKPGSRSGICRTR